MKFKSRLALVAAVVGALAAGPASAQAAIVFDGSPGTGAPPSTLGPFSMTPFGADPRPDLTDVSDAPGPTGDVGFTPVVSKRTVPGTWSTWSHGYTGTVYYTNGGTSVTVTMPADTDAFYFYAEPNQFGSYDITAVAEDGSSTSSGPIPVEGNAGAKYFGFYGTGGEKIDQIVVSATTDFALGEFGIAGGGGGPSGPSCFGQAATIDHSGDNSGVTVDGTAGDDVIVTGNGDDTVDGKGGNDVICSQGGNDTVRGGAGDDDLFGGNDNDRVQGQAGDDSAFGGNGNDTVSGGDGTDEVRGQDGDDEVQGGNGDNDQVYGGRGNDTVIGGNGTGDHCDGDAGSFGPQGIDRTTLNGGCETMVNIP